MKRIALCADDYGMTPDISEAILTLAEQGSIQATSCMVTSVHWPDTARELQYPANNIDTGLHLNFTEGAGLSKPFRQGFSGLYKMLITSHFRLLNKKHLLQEIHAQFDAFTQQMGKTPDFVDGHQHVHHLPQVREALLEVMIDKAPPSTWVRSVTPLITPNKNLKSQVIEGSGANSFKKKVKAASFLTNSAFAGVYSLSENEPYRPLMQNWLNALPDGSLIMCHPGTLQKEQSEQPLPDHAAARQLEFNYLSSPEFNEDCRAADVQRVRLSDILNQAD